MNGFNVNEDLSSARFGFRRPCVRVFVFEDPGHGASSGVREASGRWPPEARLAGSQARDRRRRARRYGTPGGREEETVSQR